METKLRDGGEPPNYTHTDHFTLEIHHGGYFNDGFYMGGTVHWADNFDKDLVSLLDLVDLAKQMGYKQETTEYFYKQKRKGWVPITTDEDFLNCAKLLSARKVAVVYFTHKTQLEGNFESQASVQSVQSQDSVQAQDNVEAADVIVAGEETEKSAKAGLQVTNEDAANQGLDSHVLQHDVCFQEYAFLEDNLQFQEFNGRTYVDYGNDVGVADYGADDEGAEQAYEQDEDEGLIDVPVVVDEDDDQQSAEQNVEDDEDDEDFLDSEFEQSEGENDCKFSRFVVNEDVADPHKEPGEVSTDEYDSEDFASVHESEDEGEAKMRGKTRRRAPKFKQYNRDHDLRDPKLSLGLEFPTMAECREAIRQYAACKARPLKFIRNDPYRIRVKCLGKSEKGDCPWLLYASYVEKGPTVRIKTLNQPDHWCGRLDSSRFATSSWLAARFDEDLRTHPKMSVPDFIQLVRKNYNIDVTKDQVYKAKQMAAEKIQGSIEEQYEKLWDYCAELKKQNPGSTVLVKTSLRGDDTVFERMYVCFEACRKGFIEGCRTMVGFDGCHIKGPHPGQLLSVVGIDANNGMFPIAFAVAEIESRETWTWFMEIFFSDVGIGNRGKGWVFISDKQKGLGQAITRLMPEAEHRHCVRHLHNNWRSVGHGSLALKQRLWAAARASTIPWYDAEMDKIRALSGPAASWFDDKPPCHWSRSHFSTGPKCDILLNNLCECFNAQILEARDRPILTMMERIRSYLMLRIARQREVKWNQKVGPRILKILEKNHAESGSCIAHNAGGGKFQVSHMNGAQYAVDLNRRTCSCRKWDLCGIPCCHAMAAIGKQQRSVMEYVDPAYSRMAYDRAYGNFISPMPSSDLWVKTGVRPIKPPVYHKQTGRPKKKRVKEVDEIPAGATKLKRYNIIVHCRTCRGEGHNSSTCAQRDRNIPHGPAQPSQTPRSSSSQPSQTPGRKAARVHGPSEKEPHSRPTQASNVQVHARPVRKASGGLPNIRGGSTSRGGSIYRGGHASRGGLARESCSNPIRPSINQTQGSETQTVVTPTEGASQPHSSVTRAQARVKTTAKRGRLWNM